MPSLGFDFGAPSKGILATPDSGGGYSLDSIFDKFSLPNFGSASTEAPSKFSIFDDILDAGKNALPKIIDLGSDWLGKNACKLTKSCKADEPPPKGGVLWDRVKDTFLDELIGGTKSGKKLEESAFKIWVRKNKYLVFATLGAFVFLIFFALKK